MIYSQVMICLAFQMSNKTELMQQQLYNSIYSELFVKYHKKIESIGQDNVRSMIKWEKKPWSRYDTDLKINRWTSFLGGLFSRYIIYWWIWVTILVLGCIFDGENMRDDFITKKKKSQKKGK